MKWFFNFVIVMAVFLAIFITIVWIPIMHDTLCDLITYIILMVLCVAEVGLGIFGLIKCKDN